MATRKSTRTSAGTAARKAPAKKSAAKKAASRSSAAKTSTRKATKKTATKAVRKAAKKVARKTATVRKAPARKVAATKKAATKKAAPRKVARKTAKKVVRKTSTTRTPAKSARSAARKTVERTAGTTARKATARKTTARKTTARKSAAATAPRPTGAASRRTGATRTADQDRPQTVMDDTPRMAKRRQAARNEAETTVRSAVGTTTNFGTTRAASPRAPDRGTSRTDQPHHITPEEALENTRQLLEAKQARDRQPPAWRQFDAEHGQPAVDQAQGHGALEDDQARAAANRLHAAEIRLDANQGSVSERDRHQQGRTDARK